MIKYLLLLPLFIVVSCDGKEQDNPVKVITQHRYEIQLKDDTPYFISCASEEYWLQGNVNKDKGGMICQPKEQVLKVIENAKKQENKK